MGAMSRPYAESPTELPSMRFPTDYRVPEAERLSGRGGIMPPAFSGY